MWGAILSASDEMTAQLAALANSGGRCKLNPTCGKDWSWQPDCWFPRGEKAKVSLSMGIRAWHRSRPRLALGVLLLSLAPLALSAATGVERSTQITGSVFVYQVTRGDSLTLVGARLGIDVATLAAQNGLSPQARLKTGQRLEIDNRHLAPGGTTEGIVINVPQRMLFLFRAGKLERAFPVAVGRSDWPTPRGKYSVLEKVVDKTWIVPRSIQEEMRRKGEPVETRVPPGPENPLGERWLRISPSCGIHGTNAPPSIYQFSTHGCIRLQPDAIDELYREVAVGTPVEVIYQPVLVGVVGGSVFLEVQRDVYRRAGPPLEAARDVAGAAGWAGAIDWDKAREIIRAREGIARAVGKVSQSSSAQRHRTRWSDGTICD